MLTDQQETSILIVVIGFYAAFLAIAVYIGRRMYRGSFGAGTKFRRLQDKKRRERRNADPS